MKGGRRNVEPRFSDLVTRVTRLMTWAAVLVTVAAVAAFSASTREPTADPPATPSTGPEPRAAVAASADAAVRGAMLSIYWYARFPDADALPEQVRPMPPEEAVRLLREQATDPAGESRRRRAIAKLYAGARTHERLQWLAALGAPLDALNARIQMSGDGPAADPYVVEQMAIQVMEEVLGPSMRDCKRTLPDWTVPRSRMRVYAATRCRAWW
jgi:hypothetical protein